MWHLLFPMFLLSYVNESFATNPLWGTFRPQALISARAAVPHSPLLGFMYHPASSLAIRHLSTEHHDKISSFSWSRHDGRRFGDQHIVDHDLNLRFTTSFQHHPSHPDAWAIRVSAVPLDNSKPTQPVSLVFYAAAGPDEVHQRTGAVDPTDAHLWGSVRLADHSQLSKEGLLDDVVLEGEAASVGGAYRVVVKEPAFGVVSDVVAAESAEPQPASTGAGSGSRAYRRARGDKPDIKSLPVHAFHVASLPDDAKFAWAVEKALDRLLRKPRESASHNDPEPLVYLLNDVVQSSSPGVLVQRLVRAPFQMESTFVRSEGRTEEEVRAIEEDLVEDKLDQLLKRSRERFDYRFERVFGLAEKGVSVEEQAFARAALSNLLGGIGFFYGSSVVQKKTSDGNGDLEFLNPVGLLTATPSRALFPRGFLWDEGFHQLVVQRWDSELSRDCMRSWMAAIQATGWIPREQILGVEARNRFPEHVRHLMIQNPKVANPPTILMPLRVLASIGFENFESNETSPITCRDSSVECETNDKTRAGFSRSILEHVIRYYSWLKQTQSGMEPNSFRWRGRSSDIKAPEGYPLTLASGLDDYPRAEVPSTKERHVDLHCWMTWASGTLAKLSEKAGKDSTGFWEEYRRLRGALIDLHGSKIADASTREDMLLCDYDGDEKICHEGYTTILPLVLGLLDPSDTRIGAILDALEDPLRLRARAGVRSLSKSDEWHRKGDDYWTGSVWMPFNFLTLAALKTKYAVEEGPYRERAARVWVDLRKSILENAFRVFSETGQLWENYSPDEDASGKSGRQFTGWSSLVLLMYADFFDGVT